METINSIEDLKENVETSETYSDSNDPMYVNFYKERIKLGRCFVAYQRNNEYHFAPSRFIGYKNNSMEKHQANDEKDGRETNSVIDRIVGEPHTPNNDLENLFRQFCNHLGIVPANVNRKYWSI